jgi:tRNA dimethylallyltransferase
MKDSEENNRTIPVLTGPTGSGKSAVINKLLERYPKINIISADSRQIYRQLDIGTDKPSQRERDLYNYNLIDICDPGNRYTAFDFVADANKIIDKLMGKGELPLISGGTGLYIRSLVEGIVEIPEDDLKIRARIEDDVIEKGPQYLYERLLEIDPDEARKIHPNNIRRVIRAIEIHELTGQTKTQIMKRGELGIHKYKFDTLILMPPREELYAGINDRVDRMMRNGLLDEAEKIFNGELKRAVEGVNVIGYNELFQYLDDKISLDSAINLIKQNTRRFAKRQITWFRGMKNVTFLETQTEAFSSLLKYYPDLN